MAPAGLSIDRAFLPRDAERQIELPIYTERSVSVEELEKVCDWIEKALLDRQEELEIAGIPRRFVGNAAGHQA